MRTLARLDSAVRRLQAQVAASPAPGALAAHTALTTGAHGGIVSSADSRLSDARPPTAHTHAQSEVTGLVAALAAAGGTVSYASTAKFGVD